MKLLFCRSNTLSSHAVRVITWSDFSHVAIADPASDRVLEAVWPRVRSVPLSQFLAENDIVVAVEAPCPNPQAGISWGLTQLGKPYDLEALGGIVLHRDWHSEYKWFCSEYATVLLEKSGLVLFRLGVKDHVFPQHLWMLNFSEVAI